MAKLKFRGKKFRISNSVLITQLININKIRNNRYLNIMSNQLNQELEVLEIVTLENFLWGA